MKISFFSNFLNDHQMPLCQEFLKDSQIDFVFVAFETIAKERLDLGFKDMNKNNFVLRVYDGENEAKMAMKLCMESDIVILGSAPEKYIKERMKKGLLTFRYSERIYKKGLYHFSSPAQCLIYIIIIRSILKSHFIFYVQARLLQWISPVAEHIKTKHTNGVISLK